MSATPVEQPGAAEIRAKAEWVAADSPVPLEQSLARDVLALLARLEAAGGEGARLRQALERIASGKGNDGGSYQVAQIAREALAQSEGLPS